MSLSLRKTWGRKSQNCRDYIVVENLCFQNVFRPAKRKNRRVLKFLRFEEWFQKALFSWRISVDGRPNRRNKAAFSNSSGAVCTGSMFGVARRNVVFPSGSKSSHIRLNQLKMEIRKDRTFYVGLKGVRQFWESSTTGQYQILQSQRENEGTDWKWSYGRLKKELKKKIKNMMNTLLDKPCKMQTDIQWTNM